MENLQAVPSLNVSIEKFVDYVNAIFERNQVINQRKILVINHSGLWTKLVTEQWSKDELISRSVYAFISRTDNCTKTLGQLVHGGIYKPASWAAPAKHARGNVFDEKSWTCAGEYGIVYLK
ncbi:MAG: hypothetical protein E6Q36_01320 [Chryseobacterium sp.]|jgi:hypothetical protein|nr:MAG: hypothetical protein E6Q36_01320 [Chryseobacterium sp.]